MSTKRGDPRSSSAYKKRRLQVLARDQWTCTYCQQPATTVDHVIPIKAGGDPIDLSNLVACCVSCNSRKGSRSEYVFLSPTSTPPVFIDSLSPIRSEPIQDSPFTVRPNPEGY